jgi:tetratricopeptide (TPR) repeat protein
MATLARAGLFDPEKPTLELAGPDGLKALPHDTFRLRLADVWSMGTALPETSSRRKALAAKDAIVKGPSRTPTDLVRLGILRLRLREYDAALADLQEAYNQNRRDFWTMTAQGTYYLQTGQSAEAARHLEAARDLSPGSPKLSAAAIAVCDAEFKLSRLRWRDQVGLPSGRRPPPPDNVDDLFDVKFVGESGEYEAGTLAASEKAKLPADAIAIVQQLLVWLPDDARLLWLLGELYNANGDLDSALTVFNECMDARRFDTPKLRQHRQATMAAISDRQAAEAAIAEQKAIAEQQTAESAWRPNNVRLWIAAGLAIPVVIGLACLQYRQLARRWKR